MTTLEIWLLAVSLAIDCFSVSVASGGILKKIRWGTFLLMAFLFGFFQAMMPFLGWSGASFFQEMIREYDHWVSFALLAFIGVRMIKESFEDEEERSFNPSSLKVMLTLSVATSIDALAVGISLAFTGYETLGSLAFPLFAIGLASFVLSVAGCLIGVYVGKKLNIKMEIFGGLVLIGIGVKILIEHLFG